MLRATEQIVPHLAYYTILLSPCFIMAAPDAGHRPCFTWPAILSSHPRRLCHHAVPGPSLIPIPRSPLAPLPSLPSFAVQKLLWLRVGVQWECQVLDPFGGTLGVIWAWSTVGTRESWGGQIPKMWRELRLRVGDITQRPLRSWGDRPSQTAVLSAACCCPPTSAFPVMAQKQDLSSAVHFAIFPPRLS